MRPVVLLCIVLAAGGSAAAAQPPPLHEALNFADGSHTTLEIADELSAEYGPVPLGLVTEYLQALKGIGIVQ